DWSSDVCSSDLPPDQIPFVEPFVPESPLRGAAESVEVVPAVERLLIRSLHPSSLAPKAGRRTTAPAPASPGAPREVSRKQPPASPAKTPTLKPAPEPTSPEPPKTPTPTP